MALASLLDEGQRVDIIAGNHKGKVGEVKSLTAKMATVRLDDGDEVRVYQNSLQAKAVAATLPFGRRSEAAEAAEPLKFKVDQSASWPPCQLWDAVETSRDTGSARWGLAA
mmetsp:Transcript_6875/g.7810  ORF Transcript_6875/g.7810 Transcript_6875/m.7810 type:complete len:111 (-) Transcript_6875:8-340(-)